MDSTEQIARMMAFAKVGDPDAVSIHNKPRWTWFVEDAERYQRLFPDACPQATISRLRAERDELKLKLALSKPLYSRRQLEAERDGLRKALEDIQKLIRTPSNGQHAYTHFMRDFDAIRKICRTYLLPDAES